MGQKGSRENTPFEYDESIFYANDTGLFKHDIKNNTSEIFYTFKNSHVLSFLYNNRLFARIATVGKAILIVIFRTHIVSFDDVGYLCSVILLDSKGREWASKDYDMGINAPASEWLDIDKVKESKIKILQEIVSARSLSAISPKGDPVFHLKSTYFEGYNLENLKDLFVKTPEPLQYKILDLNHTQLTLGDKTSILEDRVLKVFAFDHYNKKLLTCETFGAAHGFQWWIKNNDTWEKYEWCKYLMFNEDSSTDYIYQISEMIVSKNYVFLQMMDRAGQSVIIVMDKYLLMEIHRLCGDHMFYQDDYDIWFKKSMKILKGIDIIKKMSSDVLGIILSFV